MPDDLEIRAAAASDLPAILEIYNEVIASSTAVFALTPTTLEERGAWYARLAQEGHPVIVASAAGAIAGFAAYSTFRGSWPGYRYSVEHSVHVRRECRGRGVGPRLIGALVDIASEQGKHVMIGGIDAANEGSLRMHARLGFERVAHFREVGHKFGRWLDLVFVQRLLDAPGAQRA
jgi:phosphinothricin acetyltransferase